MSTEPGGIGTRLQPYPDDKLQEFVNDFQMLPADEVTDATCLRPPRRQAR